MKKMIAVLSLLSIILSFASCQQNGKFEIAETKDIVLGNQVDSVVLVTGDGEEITVENGADFYEIFNKIGLAYDVGEKYSFVAETKLGDNSKTFINMNVYYLTDGQFWEITAKKDGEDAFSVIEEYHYHKQLSDQKPEMRNFGSYTYQEEKAFGGSESGTNGMKEYRSDAYPLMPEVGTELNEMLVRSNYLKKMFLSAELFQSYEPYEANHKTYDFNDFVTREYTLYENYIVFKQTAPFIGMDVGAGHDLALLYASFLNADCSITQEAYCNVKTGEIEFIKVYGDTLWYLPEYLGMKMEINILIYVHDVGESEGEKKADQLIEYIKSNTDSQ